MRHVLAVAAVLFFLLSSAGAEAQQLPFLRPLSWNLEGTWELQPARFPRRTPATASCFSDNHAMWGHDRLELAYDTFEERPTSPARPMETRFIYRGVYRHFHSSSTVVVDQSDPSFHVVTDPLCGLEEIEIPIVVTLFLQGREDERYNDVFPWRIEVAPDGPAPTPVSGEHSIVYTNLAGYPDFARLDQWPFQNIWGTRIYVPFASTPPYTGPFSFRGQGDFVECRAPCGTVGSCAVLPGGAEDGRVNASYGTLDFGYVCPSALYDPRGWIFRRTDDALRPFPGGSIVARVFETLPDGSVTTTPVPDATVKVYRQSGRIRARMSGETADAYQAYLGSLIDGLTPVVTARTAQDTAPVPGQVRVDDLSLFAPVGGSRAALPAFYLFETSDARRDLPGGPAGDELVYRVERTPNFRPDPAATPIEQPIYLVGLDGIGAKRSVATALRDLAPGNYRPIEMDVLSDLAALGTSATRPQIEGVQRAVWAERAIYYASVHAKELLGIMLRNLAKIINALAKPYLESGTGGRGQETLRNARSDVWSTAMMNGLSSNSFRDATTRLDALRRSEVVRNYEFAQLLKLFVKHAIFQPLANHVVTSPDVLGLLDLLEKATSSLIDLILNGDASGAAAGNIDFFVGSVLVGPAFDNPLTYSYTSLLAPQLVRSRTGMNGWSTDDRASYRADRDATIALIQEMNQRVADVTEDADDNEIVSSALGDAADIFELVDFIPAAQFAQKASSVLSKALTVQAFLAPGELLFVDLPDYSRRSVDTMFQMSSMAAVFGSRTGTPIAPYRASVAEAQATLDAVTDGPIAGMRAALAADDLDALVALATDESAAGLRPMVRAHQSALARLSLATRAKIYSDAAAQSATQNAQRQLARTTIDMDLGLGAVNQSTLLLWAGALDGEYDGFDDEAYRRYAQEASRGLDFLAAALAESGTLLDEHTGFLASGTAYPAVQVEVAVTGAGGEPAVTAVDETLTVTATLHGVSTADVTTATAHLELGATAGYVLTTPADIAVARVPADGTTTATWTLRSVGAVTALDTTSVTVTLLEAGAAPTSFYAAEGSARLGPDVDALDADADGLADRLGVTGGLFGDHDLDGLSNREELLRGTDPARADSDGDGLDDLEELRAGADGWVTDPMTADTDGDGMNDASDGAPLDGDATSGSPPAEPVVAVDVPFVRLTAAEPIARLTVQNAGGGTLFWTAVSGDASAVSISRAAPLVGEEGDALSVSLADLGRRPADDAADVYEILLMDARGADPDVLRVPVVLGGGPFTPPGPDGGVGGDGGTTDGGLLDTGVGTDGGPIAGGDGGCGCEIAGVSRAATAPKTLAVLLLVGCVAAGRRRRRHRARARGQIRTTVS